MPTQAGFIMLVAQYSETDCRYAAVLVIYYTYCSAGIFKGIEVIIPFEVPPVLLKAKSIS